MKPYLRLCMKTYFQQTNTPDSGSLQVRVTSSQGLIPVRNAKVTISLSSAPNTILAEETTNEIGRTTPIELPAPPIEYSLQPDSPQPYSNYNISVTAEGYAPVLIEDSELLANEESIQPIQMNPLFQGTQQNDIVIAPHTLYYEYPPKIPEAEIKPMPDTGEIVLSRVVIPEYIIVHDGLPNNANAKNYYVPYTDYIKNVVSSEIYATWPEEAIYANTLAIMSFTLNRVYTEWYRNQGYDFTITSSTAYDQKWIYGRNIFENISDIVDSIFNNFLSRPGISQPIFTAYCDGKRTTCRGLSQWGSRYLAEEGYSPIEILRYYYGNDMYINSTDYVSGVPSSYPGYVLTRGSRGEKVGAIQEQLNRIAQNYPLIPTLDVDGIYGPKTAEAVRIFQGIFNLPQTGNVDLATWYKISQIYVGVSRIAEPG